MSLACFRFNSEYCGPIGMSPFKAKFFVDAFEAWAGFKAEAAESDYINLAQRLSLLQKVLVVSST